MVVGRFSRWWWTLVILPAMAVSACGGSRLTHDTIVAAVNGGPLATTHAQQQMQQGAVSTLPQNGVIPSAPGNPATGSGSGAGNATSVTGATGTGGGGIHGIGSSGAVAAAGAGPSAARPAGPLAPILVGNIGNYSGPAGSSLSGAEPMIRLWAQWINARGGIAGHPVQIFTADDGGDPQKSLSLVKDMVEDKHVIAFVGDQIPFTMKSQLAYLHQHNIPLVGGDALDPAWTADSLAFPSGTTFAESVLGMYKTAHQRNLIKLGLVYCVEAPVCSFVHDYTVNGGASRAGEDLVYQSQISLTQPDYTAQCLGAQSAGAQVVFLGMDTNSILRFAASCARQNYHPIYIQSSLAANNALLGNRDLEGFFTASQVFPFMVDNTPATALFHQAAQQYDPSLQLSVASAVAWSAGQLLARAASEVGAVPTTQDILNGLWRMHGETLDGLTPPLTYVKNQPSPPVQCYFLIELKGGRYSSPSGDTYAC
jgi:branched-chain amino acid transport system substrate-binding protein